MRERLLPFALLIVAVPAIGIALWLNWIGPIQERDENEDRFEEFVQQAESSGGEVALVSTCSELFNPLTWPGRPCAADGALPLGENAFLYVRWRRAGESISRSYVLSDCQAGTFRELSPLTYFDIRERVRFDIWGRPLPTDFEQLPVATALSLAGESEAQQMLNHEHQLLCSSDGSVR